MDLKGQSSLEFLLISTIILALIIASSLFIFKENELNIAVSAAKSGVSEGILLDSSAIYPKETFDDYYQNKISLTHPNIVKLIKIEYKNIGFDSKYNKTRIQFKVYVSSESILNKTDQNSAGDRINFNLRKSISKSFNTSNLSNKLYNPAFSPNYIYTTAKVIWV